jgi:hypothetical protein
MWACAMNDFTKGELIALENAMENMLLLHRTQDGESPLKDKIQFMIDNYCEHHWRCFDDEHNTRECMNCGARREGEIND